MGFSAAAVANEFLRLAKRDGKDVTPLKMQKLAYFAHGWHLALFQEPLLDEAIQAWKFGPVISSLYQQFKRFGSGPIREPAMVWTQDGYSSARMEREGSAEDVANARAVIDKVWEQYGPYSASRLTALTHSPDAPWSLVPNKDKLETPIPNNLISKYFERQYEY